MCLNLTEFEDAEIHRNFMRKLGESGYELDMDHGYLAETGYYQLTFQFGMRFTYFLLEYNLIVEEIDGLFYVTERTSDLRKVLGKKLGRLKQKEKDYIEVKWHESGKGFPSRDEIVNHLKTYTPKSYYSYIEELHKILI